MATVNNIKELAKLVNKMAAEAMSKGNAVKNTVIEEGKTQVQETVYDVYSPKVYERTGQLKENWNWQDTPNGIEIINTRTDKETGKYIPDTIEYGRNYDYEFEYSNKPRPFIENTVENLKDSNKLNEAMKKDLKNIGLDVT
jgi:hypothetical protein